MNNESEEATAIPVLDAGWEIHEIVQTLWYIPHALSMASDNAANNATLRHPHDANAHRRALRRLDRSLQALWRSLETAAGHDPPQQTTGMIVCETVEDEGPNENENSQNEESSSAPLFQQTQESTSPQLPKDSHGSKEQQHDSLSSFKNLRQTELRNDLLFLFIHLQLHDLSLIHI